MSPESRPTRRRVLYWSSTAALLALAGCGGNGGEPTPGDSTSPEPAADPGTAAGDDVVPPAERTATAIGGQQRDPSALSTKEAVSYQSEPNEGQQCDGCQFYIPDQNGDGMGACAIVEGQIAPDAWCASFVATE